MRVSVCVRVCAGTCGHILCRSLNTLEVRFDISHLQDDDGNDEGDDNHDLLCNGVDISFAFLIKATWNNNWSTWAAVLKDHCHFFLRFV